MLSKAGKRGETLKRVPPDMQAKARTLYTAQIVTMFGR